MSVLDASSEPCASVVEAGAGRGAPDAAGVGEAGAGRGAPDAAVGAKTLSPSGCSACGDRTETTSSLPSARPPAVIAPSGAMVTELGSVPAGRLMPGCTYAPLEVTRRPVPSTWSDPSRVSAIVPS